jgi:hypothetical protein
VNKPRGTYGSVHALPLRLRGEAIGTLNLFLHAPGTLSEADLALGQALADMATIGILSERAIRRSEVVSEQLQSALNSRIVIDRPRGCWPSAVGSAWTLPSTGCVATPVSTTFAWPTWPARSC